MKSPAYNADAGPAEYEHRGGDECPVHGPNVVHFRLKGSTGPFFCVACAQEQLAAPESSGVVAKPQPGNGATDWASVAAKLHMELQSAQAEIARLTRLLDQREREIALSVLIETQARLRRFGASTHEIDEVVRRMQESKP